MKPRVCICCGEPMPAAGASRSRNPNLCASCSSLADGFEEPAPVTPVFDERNLLLTDEKPVEARKAA